MGERPTPDARYPGKRRPPRRHRAAPTARKASLQERALWGGDESPGLYLPHPQPVVVGPGRTPERTGGRGWESARPKTCHTEARGAPTGRPRATPQHAKPARKSTRCGVVTGPHARAPPHPQPVGIGPRRTPQRTGGGEWESARPRTLHTQARGAPPRRSRGAPAARKARAQERALWRS